MTAFVLVASLVTIPPGWVDLVGDVPEKNFEGVPEALVEKARAGKFARIAVSPDRQATMTVLASPDLGYLDDNVLDAVAKGMPRTTTQEKGFVRIHWRRTGKIVASTQGEEAVVRSVTYLVPAGESTVGISYFAREEEFDKHRVEFETAAAATIVAINPAWWQLGRDEVILGGMILVVISVIVASVLNRRTRMS